MAKRRGFLSRLISRVFESRQDRESRQRREERQFRRGKEVTSKTAERYAQRVRDQRATRNAQQARRAREKRAQRSPYEDLWRQQRAGQARGSYSQHRAIFMDLPGVSQMEPDERLELWDSYIRYMVKGRGFQLNSVSENPFWSEIGLDPRNFAWVDWRAARGRITP